MTTGSLPPAAPSPMAPPEDDERQPSSAAGRQWLALAIALAVGPATMGWLPCPASAQPPPDQEPPLVELGEGTLTVRGATPGGLIAWFGVLREHSGYAPMVLTRQGIAQAGNDGAAGIELDRAVPPQSIWFVVDLERGLPGTASPQAPGLGAPPRPPLLTLGRPDRIAVETRHAYVFVSRPGTGAWWGFVGDGGVSDEGIEGDGKVEILVASLRPIGDSPEPPRLVRPHDVVVVVEPKTLDFRAVSPEEE